MTVALASAGTLVWAAAQTLAVPYPTGAPAAGDALVLTRLAKPDTAALTTPSGWTLLDATTGGAGTLGNDTGPLLVARYWREATGSESGSLTVESTSGTVDVQGGYMSWWTKAAATTWSVAAAGGADTVVGTDWSVTMATDPGLTVGDQVEVLVGWQTDAARTWSAEVLAAAGATITAVSVPVVVGSTALGADMAARVHHFGCTAGTGTAAPTYTATINSGTNMAGVTSLVRLRELVDSPVDSPGSAGPRYTTSCANGRATTDTAAGRCTTTTQTGRLQ